MRTRGPSVPLCALVGLQPLAVSEVGACMRTRPTQGAGVIPQWWDPCCPMDEPDLVEANIGQPLAVVGNSSHEVFADPEGFVFTPLVFLGDPTPKGEQFLNSFDSSRINNRGDVQFSSIVTTEGEGREFLLRKGEITEIPICAGEPAPGRRSL